MTDTPAYPKPVHGPLGAMDVPMYSDNELRKAVAKAVAAEREACAKLAELHASPPSWCVGESGSTTLRRFADLIRARTTP